jgi:uncharacterized membrane protein
MTLFQVTLVLAAFLCSLVAGFLFAFAIVIMPGIRSLDDGGFIRAFQVIDGIIQKGQPLFLLVWLGSALALIAAAVLGIWALSGIDRSALVLAALIYLFGVQLPTMTINIPLNNRLQRLDPGTMDATARSRARADFEPRWNRWNAFRTICANLASILLLLLLLRSGGR